MHKKCYLIKNLNAHLSMSSLQVIRKTKKHMYAQILALNVQLLFNGIIFIYDHQ